jgi:hypothetical protein
MVHSHISRHISENIVGVHIDVDTRGGREDKVGNIYAHMDRVDTELGIAFHMVGNYGHMDWSMCGHMSMFGHISLYMVYEVGLDDILRMFLGKDDHTLGALHKQLCSVVSRVHP